MIRSDSDRHHQAPRRILPCSGETQSQIFAMLVYTPATVCWLVCTYCKQVASGHFVFDPFPRKTTSHDLPHCFGFGVLLVFSHGKRCAKMAKHIHTPDRFCAIASYLFCFFCFLKRMTLSQALHVHVPVKKYDIWYKPRPSLAVLRRVAAVYPVLQQ